MPEKPEKKEIIIVATNEMRENQQIIVFSKDSRIVSWFLQQSVYFVNEQKRNENIPTKSNNL